MSSSSWLSTYVAVLSACNVAAVATDSFTIAQVDPRDEQKIEAIMNPVPDVGGVQPSVFLKPVIGSNMVLKAEGSVLFGNTTPGAAIKVLIFPMQSNGNDSPISLTATANATGYWLAKVPPFKPGLTAYNMSATSTPTTGTPLVSNITNVLFGDTLLCSGQSNMDFCLGGIRGREECAGGSFLVNESVADAHLYPEIRLFQTSWGLSYYPDDPIQLNLRHFSAVCYLTAVQIKKLMTTKANTPMGLIQRSVGGTVIETWNPVSVMHTCGLKNATVNEPGTCGADKDSALYDQFITPFLPVSVTAVFWYQGESNAPCDVVPQQFGYYACLLKNMVPTWRAAFNQQFPFMVVQLAAYNGFDATSAERSLESVSQIRQDQLSVLSLPDTGIAIAIDIGDDGVLPWTPGSARHGGIHPRNKTEVGRRLALQFAKLTAPELNILADGPTPSKVVATSSSIQINFEANSSQGLTMGETAQCHSHGKLNASISCCSVQGGMPFEIGLTNGSYVVINATNVVIAKMGSVVLNVDDASSVKSVRYAFQGFPLCVLFNSAQLPASPFEMPLST